MSTSLENVADEEFINEGIPRLTILNNSYWLVTYLLQYSIFLQADIFGLHFTQKQRDSKVRMILRDIVIIVLFKPKPDNLF